MKLIIYSIYSMFSSYGVIAKAVNFRIVDLEMKVKNIVRFGWFDDLVSFIGMCMPKMTLQPL